MATLKNRGNGSWLVTVSGGYGPDGKQIRIFRTFHANPKSTIDSQRKQAEKYAAALETDFARQQITAAKKLTFSAVYADYIQDRAIVKGLAPRTIDDYRKLFTRKLLPQFGKKAIRDITASDLNAFFRKIKKEGSSGTYSRKYYQQLNELFKYAQRSGIIVTNPCGLIDPPKIDTPEAQYYDISEVPSILDAINNCPDPMWKCYFTLQFYCGSRPEEMTGLNWNDFDGNNVSISAGAYQAKGEKCKRTERPKTKKSVRKINLPPDAIKALNAWKKIQLEKRLKLGIWPNPEAVFTNELGYRISIYQPSKKWKQFTKENNLHHLPLYSLRHTNCSLLISSNALSVEEISARMGHEQTSTTLNTYSHVFSDANEKATDALLSVLESTKKKAE